MKNLLKKATAFVLILTMLLPSITLAAEHPWFTMPVLPPIFDDSYLDFDQAEYFQAWLTSLLLRMDEFDTFTAEEQVLVLSYLHVEEEPMCPEELEEWLRLQHEYLLANPYIFYESAAILLMRERASFSTLSEEEQALLFAELDIADHAIERAAALFLQAEQDGFTLSESFELVWIVATGLFDYHEAQILLHTYATAHERFSQVARFEQFARKFNIENAVNAQRLTNWSFVVLNLFEDMLEESHGETAEISALRTTHATLTTAQSFDGARQMLLSGHGVDEIMVAFGLVSALQAVPQTFAEGALPFAFEDTRAFGVSDALGVVAVLQDVWLEFEELEDIIAHGLGVMQFGAGLVAPLSTHEDIVANPFRLNFSANESVNLHTGAAYYRVPLFSLPGQGGFGFDLSLLYRSNVSRIYSPAVHFLGVGWMFDLPYIRNNVMYIPGRGRFTINGTHIQGHTLHDMRLHNDTTFITGIHHSTRRLTFHNGVSYFFDAQGYIIGMEDRFGNRIEFRYVLVTSLRALEKIIIGNSGNEQTIVFQNQAAVANRTITITAPDGSTYVITMTRASGQNYFLTESIRNPLNMVTTFAYVRGRTNRTIGIPIVYNDRLLSQVTYPSGTRLFFGYTAVPTAPVFPNTVIMTYVSRVGGRSLQIGTRTYLSTSFAYSAYTQPSNFARRVAVTENNGRRTEYSFNHQNLMARERVFFTATGTGRNQELNTTFNNDRLPLTTVQMRFTASGLLTFDHWHFTYNRYGQATSISQPNIRQGTLYYRHDYTFDDRFGLLASSTFRPDNNTTVRTVNSLSDDGRSIIRTEVFENDMVNPVSRTRFVHDDFGNVIRIYEYPDLGSTPIVTEIHFACPHGSMPEGVMPFSIRTLGVYDAWGNRVGGDGIVGRQFTYDALWRVTSETDPNGYTTSFVYDAIGRILRITFPDDGFVTYQYNDRTNTVTHRTVLGAVYTYQYSGLGKLLTVSVGGREIVRNSYDNRMRLIQTQNHSGIASSQRTTFTYDLLDRVTAIRQIHPVGNGILQEQTIQYFDATHTVLSNQVVTTIRGNTTYAPNIQSFVQYRDGRIAQQGVVGGRIIHYEYDLAGRVTREHSLGINNRMVYNVFGMVSVTNILGHTASTMYDSMGRVTAASDFMGYYTQFRYDAVGRLIEQRVPFEDTHYAITRYTYDRNGNVTGISTLVSRPGAAQAWTHTVNRFRHNRLESTRVGVATLNATTGGIFTQYTYDYAGNILTMRVGTGAELAETTFEYNNRGQLVWIRDALVQTGHNRYERFEYDHNGLLVRRTDRSGTVFTMTYNNLGQLIREVARPATGATLQSDWTFAMTGALRTEVSGGHTITHYYDAQGRIIRQRETGGIEREYQWNAANNRTRFTLRVNNVTQIARWYTYDAAQRLLRVGPYGSSLEVVYTYNANGQVIRRALGNGMVTEYVHNRAGLVTSLTTRMGNMVLSSFRYYYYLDGNVYRVVETRQGYPERVISYGYDLVRRLTVETDSYTGVTRSYAFDSRGNRIGMTVEGGERYTVRYTYNLNNQLTDEVRTGQGASTTTYTFDSNGNQLTRTVDSPTGRITETWDYNALNQLTLFVRQSGTTSATATYAYRADGLRLSRIVTSTGRSETLTHVWDGAFIVLELNASGGVVNRFNRGLGGRLVRSSQHGWYVFDRMGSVVQRVGDDGRVLRNYRYTAFGIELNYSAQNLNPWRFQSMYWDWCSGTYFTPFRNMNPQTGRWLSPDPFFHPMWGGVQGNTAHNLQAGNLSMFVMHNPVFWRDPTGLSAAAGAIVGGAIGGIGGFFSGGFSAAIRGEPIVAGAVSGAVGGATGGAIAGGAVGGTIGFATPSSVAFWIGLGAGAVGGGASSIVSQGTNYLILNSTFDGFFIDWDEVLITTIAGSLYTGVGAGLAQWNFYPDLLRFNSVETMQSVANMTSGFFTIANAGTDIVAGIILAVSPNQDEMLVFVPAAQEWRVPTAQEFAQQQNWNPQAAKQSLLNNQTPAPSSPARPPVFSPPSRLPNW